MKVSKHFKSEELECSCCGHYIKNQDLIDVLEDVREYFKVPVFINSGTRCKKHNEEVGGVPASRHVTGEASDIVVRGIEPSEVAEYLEDEHPSRFGIGQYDTFVHVDVRSKKARWTNVTDKLPTKKQLEFDFKKDTI